MPGMPRKPDPYEPVAIIELAQRIADELGSGCCIEGWIGPTGHQGREIAVHVGGRRCTAIELGEPDILAFSTDPQARAAVEERIRHQLTRVLQQ